jgi:HK97 family phage prohead protease
LVYVKPFDDKGYIFCVNHTESLGLKWQSLKKLLSEKELFALDAKYTRYFLTGNINDVTFNYIEKHGCKPDLSSCLPLINNNFYTKYGELKNINTLIPVSKHYEYCENLYNFLQNYMIKNTDYLYKLTKVFFKIEKEGIKLDNFMKNPICLFNHDRDKVIGKWVDIVRTPDYIEGTVVFDEADPEALKIKNKVENDFIKGASTGINVLKYHFDDDTEELFITESDLLECSIVSIPANEGALKLYFNEKLIKEDEVITFLKNEMEKGKIPTPDISTEENSTSVPDPR